MILRYPHLTGLLQLLKNLHQLINDLPLMNIELISYLEIRSKIQVAADFSSRSLASASSNFF